MTKSKNLVSMKYYKTPQQSLQYLGLPMPRHAIYKLTK